jgi:hypothetical protein
MIACNTTEDERISSTMSESGNNDWQSAELLRNLYGCCSGDSLSEGGLREVIECHECVD